MSDPSLRTVVEVPKVAYGIDIGVYRHGVNGTVLASTTFAWARAESSVTLTFPTQGDEQIFSFDGSYTSGRDIRDLAKAITRDLRSEMKIAIGVEAPMWQPAPTEVPSSTFDLLPIRFPQEKGFAWYLQSGAAALVKALSTGRLLFSLLDLPSKDIRCAIGSSEKSIIELFEGFVVDRWKLPGEAAFGDGAHAWDALTTAVGLHYAKHRIEEDQLLSLIHKASGCRTPVISHWETVLKSLDFDSSECKSDCMVVGFESTSDAVIQAAKENFVRRTEELSSVEVHTDSSS